LWVNCQVEAFTSLLVVAVVWEQMVAQGEQAVSAAAAMDLGMLCREQVTLGECPRAVAVVLLDMTT
jgi:hypothetical protein